MNSYRSTNWTIYNKLKSDPLLAGLVTYVTMWKKSYMQPLGAKGGLKLAPASYSTAVKK